MSFAHWLYLLMVLAMPIGGVVLFAVILFNLWKLFCRTPRPEVGAGNES
ncbi:hypothetical protein ACIBH1_30290 [Nonomuraea sp. NPDC050663]